MLDSQIGMSRRAVSGTTRPLRAAGLSLLETPKGDDMAEEDAERAVGHKDERFA